MAVTTVLTAVSQKLKNVNFTKRLEAATNDLLYCKIQSQLGQFRLNAFLYTSEQPLCLERNEREIPLALYIRLEYSKTIRIMSSLHIVGNVILLYI